ncbi:MAG: NADH-quinone oxidoreductase subunit J [Nitrospirota bacterium]
MTQSLFFFYFASATLISSALTVFLRSPVHCTVALLSALLHVAGLFIILNAEFIAAIQIIIYAGAVLVLYLFVLMLLNLKQTERVVNQQVKFALFFGAVILGEILLAISQSSFAKNPNPRPFPNAGNTESIGTLLFTDYLLPFEVIGVLLLGGIVGALVLAKQTPKGG